MNEADQLLDHFFRHESARLVSALTGLFGPRHIELAEDVAQSALLEALEAWRFGSLPENPSGWLFRVARNRALDVLRHHGVRSRLEPEIVGYLRTEGESRENGGELFFDRDIADSELRMMFACCDPELPSESRVALTLKALCGFSTSEIADALLTSEANAQKRLQRAKSKLKERPDLLEVPSGDELRVRLDSVHTVVYLLFNEGYNSSHADELIRRSLCDEAMRLVRLLVDHPAIPAPTSRALLALMSFHTARFDARLSDEGDIVLLDEQDRSRWDADLIAAGLRLLEQASESNEVSNYHLEAAIAALHCSAPTIDQTDWQAILDIYDLLIELKPSPVYQLNRAIVVAKVRGPGAGIEEVNRIKGERTLERYHLLDATLGQLYLEAGDRLAARGAFLKARDLTASPQERSLLDRKLQSLQ